MTKNKPTSTISASVWEQWLNRLGVIPSHDGIELLRQQELLVLLIKYAQDPNRQLALFCSELCTSVNTSKYAAYIHKDSELILVENSFSRSQAKIPRSSDVTSRIKRRPTVTVERLKNSDTVKYITLIPFLKDITIALFGNDAPQRHELRFLHLFNRIVRLYEANQKLSTSLASETERFATITHHLSEGLMILDKDLNIITWNRPLQRLTGFTPKETYGKNYSSCFKSSDSNWLKEIIKDYESDKLKNVFYRDLEIRTKNNQPKWVSFSGSLLRDSEGRITQVIILVRDISKNKELENRKNEFISIATHELRTPITAVKGYLSLLNKGELTETQAKYLKNAEFASDRLVKLAEDLLQVIHVEENRISFSLRPINLCEIINSAISQLKSKAEKKGIFIRYNEPNEQLIIAADKLRLLQVLTNLIDNAIKYSVKGVIQVNSVYEKPDKASITITDQGIGMSSKDIANAFTKFHRGENGRRTSETGAGLGLFIVKNFVEKQGGTIKVKSKINQGTTFQLTFPIIKRVIMVKGVK
ncbi:PAS domain-containing sensor histidine kinase [Candidatus Berkelbacteria bacterium]|nr:PAS domain-containing sensor histidine kinase [Candidatus Berkelbacteria bacterium]